MPRFLYFNTCLSSIFMRFLRLPEQITSKFNCACWVFTTAVYVMWSGMWQMSLINSHPNTGNLINLQNNLLFVQYTANTEIEVFLFTHLKITEKSPLVSPSGWWAVSFLLWLPGSGWWEWIIVSLSISLWRGCLLFRRIMAILPSCCLCQEKVKSKVHLIKWK